MISWLVDTGAITAAGTGGTMVGASMQVGAAVVGARVVGTTTELLAIAVATMDSGDAIGPERKR